MEVYDHEYIQTNGITLHVVQAGPEDGPLVILLHGFPEYWYGWHHQIDALAARGFRVWAPDQRGYNLSDKPQGVAAYSRDQLALDVVGLIDAAGRERACVAGHDWGAGVAWWLAHKHPERVEKLVIVNVPHHRVIESALTNNPEQRRKSWYMFFFQTPWLPEFGMSVDDYRMLIAALARTANHGTFSEEELESYRQAWSQPGALTAMLNWYRAAFQVRGERPPSPRIIVPTLILWGANDAFIGRELAEESIELCDDGRLEFFEDATHWVLHEKPAETSALMAEFFSN